MKKFLLMLLTAYLCLSCEPNFVPEDGSIHLSVNVLDMFEGARWTDFSPMFKEGSFPGNGDGCISMRLSVYCYDPNTSKLISHTVKYVKNIGKRVEMTAYNLHRNRQYTTVTIVDFVYDENGKSIEFWHHENPENMNNLCLEASGEWIDWYCVAAGRSIETLTADSSTVHQVRPEGLGIWCLYVFKYISDVYKLYYSLPIGYSKISMIPGNNVERTGVNHFNTHVFSDEEKQGYNSMATFLYVIPEKGRVSYKIYRDSSDTPAIDHEEVIDFSPYTNFGAIIDLRDGSLQAFERTETTEW